MGAGSFSHAFWTNLDFPSKWYGEVQRAVTPYDLMSGQALPVEDGTAEIIYTSHTVEHVTDRAVERFFRNAFRALRLGGILRVATGPDADSNFRALEAGDADWFYWDVGYDGAFEQYSNIFHQPPSGRPLEERWLHHFASQLAPNDRSPSAHKFSAAAIREIIAERGKIGALDYFTGLCEFQPDRPFNHVSWWNAEKLVRFMRQAGFETIYRSGYGQSAAQVLRNTHFFDNTHPQMTVYVEARR
ncbi:MAG TPA: methyltransferase domain-containing protein [Propylenella sp.]|nr:methyltransferase domain-containing protein [Propylenella sp.]